MMTRTHRFGVALGVLAAGAIVLPIQAQASRVDFTVDTTADTADADLGDGACADAAGACSLRAAVQQANASVGSNVTVQLNAGTYTLSMVGAGDDTAATGDLDVTGSLAIRGNAATIDLAGSGDRAFDVLAGASLDVQGLAVANGAPPETESGGAFRNAGDLRVVQSDVYGNTVVGAGASGGAIVNSGSLAVVQSTLSGNSAARAGGAIEATSGSTTAIDRSTLSANETGPMPGNGGGFHLTGEGTVSVTTSNVNGNVAANEGGGLWNSAVGTMTVSGTNLLGNVANGVEADNGGGGIFNQGNADNTAGGTLVVDGSTIKGNTATSGSGSGGGILNEAGSLTLTGTQIRNNVAARAGGGIETVWGVVSIDRSWLVANETGPMPGNGGGLHMSGPGDVTVTRSYVDGNVAANEGGGLWNSAVGTMTVDKTRLQDNTANGVNADNGGGGIFNQGNADNTAGGTLVVTASTIRRNSALQGSGSGGGILNEAGSLTVVDTTIERNSSARAGGGIEAVWGTTVLDDVTLRLNTTGAAPGNGGGLHLSGPGVVDVVDSDIERNTAANEGGGLWNSSVGVMTVTNTTFRNNSANGVNADNGGGAIFNQGNADNTAGGTLVVVDSRLTGNQATQGSGSGGAILSEAGSVTVSNSMINANRSSRAGGGIEVVTGSLGVDGVTFKDNRTGSSPGNGGAVHVSGAATTDIAHSTVTKNIASNEGGGLWNSPTGTMTVTDTSISGNKVGVRPNGPNVFQKGPIAGGVFTVDGEVVPEGPNSLQYK